MSTPNAKITLNQLVFRSLYYRYRNFTTPVSVILVCVLLFWFVVMSQIQNFLAVRDAISLNEQDLTVLHKNLTLITSLDDAKLDATLTVATNALPAEKDFAGIITSIQQAAAVSGTILQDYTFSLGNLSGLDQQGKATQLPVQLNVILKGSIAQAQQFIKQLKNQLPLSDSIAVSLSSTDTVTVTAAFYYTSIPKIVFKDRSPLPILSEGDQKLLQALSVNSTLPVVTIPSPAVSVTPSTVPSPTISSSISAVLTPIASGSGR